MKNPMKSYFERDEQRRKTQGVENWERHRAKGKWYFILKIALLWSLLTIAGLTLFEYLLDGGIRIEIFWFKVLLFAGLGVVVGLIFWRIGERKHRNYSGEKQ